MELECLEDMEFCLEDMQGPLGEHPLEEEPEHLLEGQPFEENGHASEAANYYENMPISDHQFVQDGQENTDQAQGSQLDMASYAMYDFAGGDEVVYMMPGPLTMVDPSFSAAIAEPTNPSPNAESQRLCPDCGIVKPAYEYHTRKKGALLAAYCKLCSSARSKRRNRILGEKTRAGRAQGEGRPVAKVDRRVCSCCSVEKPAADFHPKTQSLTGLESYCRVCHALKMREYRAKYKVKNGVQEPPEDYRKICSRCHKEKPASEFHRHLAQVSGLSCYCKQCKAEMEQEKRREKAEAKGKPFIPLKDRGKAKQAAASAKEMSRKRRRPRTKGEGNAHGITMEDLLKIQEKEKLKKEKSERLESYKTRIGPNGFKICPDCEQAKPPAEYHLRTKATLGLAVYCKACSKERSAQRRKRMIEENAKKGIAPPKSRAPKVAVCVREGDEVVSKECRDCRALKPAADFNKDKKHSTGLSSYCRNCSRVRVQTSLQKRKMQNGLLPLLSEHQPAGSLPDLSTGDNIPMVRVEAGPRKRKAKNRQLALPSGQPPAAFFPEAVTGSRPPPANFPGDNIKMLRVEAGPRKLQAKKRQLTLPSEQPPAAFLPEAPAGPHPPPANFPGDNINIAGDERCAPAALTASANDETLANDARQDLERNLLCLEEDDFAASPDFNAMEDDDEEKNPWDEDLYDREPEISHGLQTHQNTEEEQQEEGGILEGLSREDVIMLANLVAVEREMLGNSVSRGPNPHDLLAGFREMLGSGVVPGSNPTPVAGQALGTGVDAGLNPTSGGVLAGVAQIVGHNGCSVGQMLGNSVNCGSNPREPLEMYSPGNDGVEECRIACGASMEQRAFGNGVDHGSNLGESYVRNGIPGNGVEQGAIGCCVACVQQSLFGNGVGCGPNPARGAVSNAGVRRVVGNRVNRGSNPRRRSLANAG